MDNPHTILGLAVPTNEPDVAFNYLLATVHNLKAVAPIASFLFNFQKPWTEEQILKAVDICEENGFEVRYSINSYTVEGKGKVPFNAIRGDACRLMPEAKFFVLMDDDFSFLPRSATCYKSAGEQYVDCIKYLTEHPDCGILLLKNKVNAHLIPKYFIMPAVSLDNVYITDKGIILRNFDPENGWVVPHTAIDLLGSDEEKVACSWRLAHGLYPAIMNFTRTLHYENANKISGDKVQSGEVMYQWNTKEILDANANRFIRENFYPAFKNRGWRPTRLIDPAHYLSISGIDFTEDDIRESLTKQVSFDTTGDPQAIIDYYEEAPIHE